MKTNTGPLTKAEEARQRVERRKLYDKKNKIRNENPDFYATVFGDEKISMHFRSASNVNAVHKRESSMNMGSRQEKKRNNSARKAQTVKDLGNYEDFNGLLAIPGAKFEESKFNTHRKISGEDQKIMVRNEKPKKKLTEKGKTLDRHSKSPKPF